jgi:hypothetical protein
MPLVPRSELVTVDDRGWPLLIIRIPPVVSSESLRSLIEAVERAYDRRQRFGVLCDNSEVIKFPDAAARRMLSDWVASPRRAQCEVAYTVATVIVVRSGPLRALSAALTLAWRRPTPHHWAGTIREGIDWLRQRLVAANVPLTPAAEALYAEAMMPPARVGRRA